MTSSTASGLTETSPPVLLPRLRLVTPSTVYSCCNARVPLMLSWSTTLVTVEVVRLRPVITPGTIFMRSTMLRPLSAMSRSWRFVTMSERSPDSVWICSRPASASTVMDSETLPTSSTRMPTFTLVAMDRMTLLFATFLKPDSSAVTVYVPGGICGKTNVPSGPDCAVWVTPRSGSTTVMVAPGRAPPLESFTVPTSDDAPCPNATAAIDATTIRVPIPALEACLTVLSLPCATRGTTCRHVDAMREGARGHGRSAKRIVGCRRRFAVRNGGAPP